MRKNITYLHRLMDLAKTGIMDILGDNSEIPIRIRTLYKVRYLCTGTGNVLDRKVGRAWQVPTL